MGSYFSSAAAHTAAQAGPKEEHSNVITVHTKSSWESHWSSHKSSNKLMVIDFSATWCGPCKKMEPVFKALAAKFTKIDFVKIDVDELPDLAAQWKVQAMPTFVLVKGGQEVSRIVGARQDELEREIQMFQS